MSFKNCIHIMAVSVLMLLSCSMAAEIIDPVFVGSLNVGACTKVQVVGNYAYVITDGSSDRALKIVDISTKANPVEISNMAMYNPQDVKIFGQHAYIADDSGRLKIVDVANPSVPVLVSTVGGCNYALGVDVAGSYAYVANYLDFKIVNITNLQAPVIVSTLTPAENCNFMRVKVAGNFAYASFRNSSTWQFFLKVIDISNPNSPVEVGSIGCSEFRDFTIAGNYAYVAQNSGGLKIIDISNPAAPVAVGSIGGWSGWSSDVSVVGNYAYVVSDMGGFKIIDISTPSSPVLIKSVAVNAYGVNVVGNYAYLASTEGGLKIFKVSNNPPSVSSFSKSGDEDATVIFSAADFINHFGAIDGPLAKIKILSLPNNGTLKLSNVAVTLNQEIDVANLGNLTFVPDANWNGNTSFSWNGFDGISYAASPADVTTTIANVEDAPVVSSLSKSSDEDTIITFSAADFTSHFSDVDNNGLVKIQVLSLPSNGTLKLSGAPVTLNQEIAVADLGNLTFAPDANWNGNTSFSWNGYDGFSYAATPADVTITVNVVDDVPVVTPIAKSVDEDGTVAFTAADFTSHFSDVESEVLSKIQITSLPSNGTLKLSGTPVTLNQEINAADLGNLTFEPAANWNGTLSFDWKGCDASACSDSSNITVTVSAINDAPVVSSLSKSVDEDGTVTFAAADFTSHFSDVENDILSKIQVLSLPANGILKLSDVAVTLNQEINASDLDNLTFVPAENWNGNTSFSWNGFDGSAYAASPADVTITVTAVNDAPVVSSLSKSVDEDGTVTFAAADFTSHFSDIENDALTKIQVLSLPSNGTLKLSNVAVTLNQEINTADLGNLTFVPDANWNGNTSFSWNGFDGSAYAATPASVALTVVSVDDAPVVTSFSKTVDEDGVVTFTAVDFSSHMTDVETESLTKIQVLSLPSNGTLKLSNVAVTLNQEINATDLGNLTFVPDANWNGNTSFIWNGYDGSSYAAATAQVVMTVAAVDDAPEITSFSKTGNEDTTVTFAATDFSSHMTDVETESLTKIQVLSLPANGTLKLSNVAVTLNQEINAADLGNLTFVPDANWNGNTSFIWNGYDGSSYAVATAQVDITITAVNDVPEVAAFSKSGNEDGTVSFTAADFTSHFSDVENDSLTKIQVLSLPNNGTLKLSNVAVTLNQEINAADLGNLTFVPDANWNGNTGFSWNGYDGSSYAATPADVTITVNAVDDAPVVTPIAKSVDEDGVITFNASDFTSHFSDIEGEGLAKIQITSLPTNGTLKLSGTPVTLNQEISASDLNNLTFEPAANWNGSTNFGWKGCDATACSAASANAAITVTSVEDVPVVTQLFKTGEEDTTLHFSVVDFTGHFTDVDGNGLTAIKVVSLPEHGTLKLANVPVALNQEIIIGDVPALTFEPESNWNGNTSFSWNGCDGTAYAAAPANVTITITSVNDAPVISTIEKSGNQDAVIALSSADFTSHFSDVEHNGLAKIQILSLPEHGTLKLDTNAVVLNQEIAVADLDKLAFEPVEGWFGETSFAWNGSDGASYGAQTANVKLTLLSVPVAASYCSEHPYICYAVPSAAVAAGTLASVVLYMSRKHMGCFKHELPTVPTRAVGIEMPKV